MPPIFGTILALTAVMVLHGQAIGIAAWDFSLYYAAGKLPGEELFNKEAQVREQQQLWRENLQDTRPYHFSVYLKPAVYKLVLTPLSRLSFWRAYITWAFVQVASLAAALWLIGRRCGFPTVLWILLPLNPYLVSVVAWGQDTGLVFLTVACAWELSERGNWFRAGSILALSLVKWNLFLLLLPMLIIQRRWRMLAGFACVTVLGAAISICITGWPGTLAYFHLLQDREADYLAPGMPSVRGVLLWFGATSLVTNGLLFFLHCGTWWMLSRLPFRAAFALAVTACIVLSYHTMLYDLLFLLIPLQLTQREDLFLSPFTGTLLLIWATPLKLPDPWVSVLTLAVAGILYLHAFRSVTARHFVNE
ncbi:MAG: DUF2029 domain-containing protein [Acidobacteria bacterium]|nr:DUF2029 domain-containing protein [Acidobacteriota bacterium]